MYLLYLKSLTVLGSTVNALYVVVELFEKMHKNTDLCIEGVFGSCKVLTTESKRYQIYQG